MVRITPMTSADIDVVMEVELDSHPEPWSRNSFLEELAQPCSRIFTARIPTPVSTVLRQPASNVGMNAIQTGIRVSKRERIVGYICFWLVSDEIQILNVAVHKAWRGQGIGKSLMRCALRQAWKHKARVAVLEVRPSNKAARLLYESLGFQSVGLRPNYYGGEYIEPAILMELDLEDYRRQHRSTEINSADSGGIT